MAMGGTSGPNLRILFCWVQEGSFPSVGSTAALWHQINVALLCVSHRSTGDRLSKAPAAGKPVGFPWMLGGEHALEVVCWGHMVPSLVWKLGLCHLLWTPGCRQRNQPHQGNWGSPQSLEGGRCWSPSEQLAAAKNLAQFWAKINSDLGRAACLVVDAEDTAAGYSGNQRKELSILWASLPQRGHPAVSASSYSLVGLIWKIHDFKANPGHITKLCRLSVVSSNSSGGCESKTDITFMLYMNKEQPLWILELH